MDNPLMWKNLGVKNRWVKVDLPHLLISQISVSPPWCLSLPGAAAVPGASPRPPGNVTVDSTTGLHSTDHHGGGGGWGGFVHVWTFLVKGAEAVVAVSAWNGGGRFLAFFGEINTVNIDLDPISPAHSATIRVVSLDFLKMKVQQKNRTWFPPHFHPPRLWCPVCLLWFVLDGQSVQQWYKLHTLTFYC